LEAKQKNRFINIFLNFFSASKNDHEIYQVSKTITKDQITNDQNFFLNPYLIENFPKLY